MYSVIFAIWELLTERETLQETFKRLAERYKTHFEAEMRRDVASFEESRIHDLLIITTQDPSQSLQRDFQQVWDQRLSHLLERRGQYLQVWWMMPLLFCRFRWLVVLDRLSGAHVHVTFPQKLECVVKLLKDGLAQHTATVSEERQERSRGVEELSLLLRSPDANTIIQLLERRVALRAKATEHLRSCRAVSNSLDSFVQFHDSF